MNSGETIPFFRDRDDAADRLAERLADLRGRSPVVLAIPRGAVPMGRRIAAALGGELDLILVKKIGHPRHPEFAVAAVDEDGEIAFSEGARFGDVDAEYLVAEAKRLRAGLRGARERYAPEREPADLRGRDVVILDDGVATGATMVAAVRAVRRRSPRSVTAAAPIASREARDLLREEGVELRALGFPPRFGAVARFYADFPQVEDEEVRRAFGNSTKKVEPRPSSLST